MRLPEDVRTTRWALGLSGGADSVALLLKCLEAGVRPVALHFNHAFADENGDEAEAFCRGLCASLGVSLTVGWRVEAPGERGSKESRARAARMAFFARELRAAGCVGILLAHQADDRAENLVLRLARGCGSEGLSSFDWGGGCPARRNCAFGGRCSTRRTRRRWRGFGRAGNRGWRTSQTPIFPSRATPFGTSSRRCCRILPPAPMPQPISWPRKRPASTAWPARRRATGRRKRSKWRKIPTQRFFGGHCGLGCRRP